MINRVKNVSTKMKLIKCNSDFSFINALIAQKKSKIVMFSQQHFNKAGRNTFQYVIDNVKLFNDIFKIMDHIN